MKKFFSKRVGAFVLTLAMVLQMVPAAFAVGPKAASAKEFVATEDASCQNGKVKNYEEITKAHGAQYEGKNYKAITVNNYSSDGGLHVNPMHAVAKFTLPTMEEAKNFNTYTFSCNVIKNILPNLDRQVYQFYLSENTSWSETAGAMYDIPADADNLLYSLTVEKGEDFEKKSDAEKVISFDMTEQVMQLIAKGAKEATILITAQTPSRTALMIHSKESTNGKEQLGPKITASCQDYRTQLETLLTQCGELKMEQYTQDSWKALEQAKASAEAALKTSDLIAVSNAYLQLKEAKENLQQSSAESWTKDYVATEDAYFQRGDSHSYENITEAHGKQYAGKNYKSIGVNRYSSDGVTVTPMNAVMKFTLPTKADLEKYNAFAFSCKVVKNIKPGLDRQVYEFYLSESTSWTETASKWNNSVVADPENLLYALTVEKDEDFEKKTEQEKIITFDITERIRPLIERGVREVSIIVTAKNPSKTALLIHSKESSDGKEQLGPKIVASCQDYREQLDTLLKECGQLAKDDYLQDSWAVFEKARNVAQNILDNPDSSRIVIGNAYWDLKNAKAGLRLSSDPADPSNIAFNKPVRSNYTKTTTWTVNDGDPTTTWKGTLFPANVDIDLLNCYDIESMKVFMPEGKVVWYSVYGSNDGDNFTRIYRNRDNAEKTAEGDLITFDTPQSYRILRIYVDYVGKGEKSAFLSEVKVFGKPSATENTAPLHEGTFEEILGIQPYDQTKYAAPITDAETIENVYGIIDRTVGPQYRSWFSFELKPNAQNEKDYFELSNKDGKIHITGNEGLSLTSGLNYYYKNYVNVHVSEETMQVAMPDKIVPINGVVRKEALQDIRYAYNYCTVDYTFAFFGKEDWQRENDWLALNGVNVVLDLAGQEATWIKFLMELGYPYEDAKDWLCGPAYYSWQFMSNMETFGGPISDKYVKERTEMARETRRWKNSLGMQTMLQGYAGMVPTNFKEFNPNAEVLPQGAWAGGVAFARPYMIPTDSPMYDEYAEKYYAAQKFIYGDTSDYYAVDPFHEGGIRPSDLSDETIAREVLESLLKADKDAVWVVQSWLSNPTKGLLQGMGDLRKDHALILDLIKYPIQNNRNYVNSSRYGSDEFGGTDWVWGLVSNFGGNPSMNAQLEIMLKDIQNARKTKSHMKGIGILSEATHDNPMVYELLFDLVWDEVTDLDTWIDHYIERRYGMDSQAAKEAWKLIKRTNYNYGINHTPESISLYYRAPESVGTQNIAYGAENLEKALNLLLADFDKLKNNECYIYDLTDVMRQHVSNFATLTYNHVVQARNSKNLDAFVKNKDLYLNAIEILDQVQSLNKNQLVGEWIGKAQDRAAGLDDFSRDVFTWNAKALFTTWGSKSAQSLKDYAFHYYSGLLNDLYKPVWEEYLNRVESNLRNGTPLNNKGQHGYFDTYWSWVLNDKDYTRTPTTSTKDIKAIVDRVLMQCSISGKVDPNIGNVALNGLAQAYGTQNTGNVANICDGKTETTFTAKSDAGKKPEVMIDLIGHFQLNKISVVGAGTGGYQVLISADGKNWIPVGEQKDGTQESENGTAFPVSDQVARFVKVVGSSTQPLNLSEVRVYGDRIVAHFEQLQELIAFAKTLSTKDSTPEAVKHFQKALADAKALKGNEGPDAASAAYWALYYAICDLNLTAKPVDPTIYTVSFQTNGGNTIDSVTVEQGKQVKQPANPTRECYVFEGWYSDEALKNAYDFATAVNGNITLYAKWRENHSFGDWHIVKEATETEEGMMERTCTVCGKKETKTIAKRVPESIAVTTLPQKTSYISGENFVSDGMVVTVTYTDGTTKVLENFQIIGGEDLKEGTKEVTVQYTGAAGDIFTAKVAITVQADKAPVVPPVGPTEPTEPEVPETEPETKPQVPETNPDGPAKTGENMSSGMFVVLATVSLAAGSLLIVLKKKVYNVQKG